MKNKIILLFSIAAFMMLNCSAQQLPDLTSDGYAKLIIEKKGAKPITYNFPGAFPSGLKCVKHTGTTTAENYTDILFGHSFDNSDGTQTLVTVTMRFWPNNVGSFKLPINGDQNSEGHITINIDKGNLETILLDDSPEKGTGGSISIENYPTAEGGKIKGIFDAKLMDAKDNIYHVSGAFNIKRKNE